uniref:Uncharacterized protein n=1 Tax=Anguilla anguilla TaxID=7936 RepID=A0A0E9TTQ3_ANGAN
MMQKVTSFSLCFFLLVWVFYFYFSSVHSNLV